MALQAALAPTVSAVITTVRPFAELAQTLKAVLASDAVAEVLLVVDGPSAATLGLELDGADAGEPRLRVLRLTAVAGADPARRIGAEAALGQVVWFLDDDLDPAPGCGRGHALAHLETGAEEVVVGTISAPPGEEGSRLEPDGSLGGNRSVRREVLVDLPNRPATLVAAARPGLVAVRRSRLPPPAPRAAPPVPADVSLLVVSRGPAARLRAVLERWRPHVAEVVLVADEQGETGVLDAVGDLLDHGASVTTAAVMETVLPWAWPLCTRSFVLRADDDEVPAEGLLAELRSLTLDGTLDQARLAVRWCWPTERTWIDEYPWASNMPPRLFRNRPGRMQFPRASHTNEHLDGPMRWLPGALYHLRTLDSIDARRSHAAFYAAITRPHLDGTPANVEYFPEEVEPATRPVPPWDRAPIAAVLAADAAGVGNAAEKSPAVVHRLESPRLPDTGRRASVRIRRPMRNVPGDAHLVLELVVANHGRALLPGRIAPGSAVALATRWAPGEGGAAVEGPRIELGEDVAAGRAVLLVVWTAIPVGPGRWTVEVDLVEEHVRWFCDGDRLTVDVTP